MEISLFIVIVFLALVVLRGVLLAVGAALIIRPVAECPACFGMTFELQRRWLRRIAPWLEWRWCPRCGWVGPAKRMR
ncbi:MAG: hypothetical protein ACT4O1_09810 [Gemmatimonadota bacterium]